MFKFTQIIDFVTDDVEDTHGHVNNVNVAWPWVFDDGSLLYPGR